MAVLVLSARVWCLRGLLGFIAILLILPVKPVQADIGPKPGMKFTFEFKTPLVEIISGELIECEDSRCEAGVPLQKLGPQHFTCDSTGCNSTAYGYSEYQKIVITFSDKIRESNVFTKKQFNANYSVTVLDNSLEVKENDTAAPNPLCCPGFLSTLVLETLLASVYLFAFHFPKTLLGWVPIASLLTLPFVWFAFPLLGLPGNMTVGVSETFAFGVEGLFLYWITNRVIPFKHAILLSLMMNGCSFIAGLLV
jgi:hypothetical protein